MVQNKSPVNPTASKATPAFSAMTTTKDTTTTIRQRFPLLLVIGGMTLLLVLMESYLHTLPRPLAVKKPKQKPTVSKKPKAVPTSIRRGSGSYEEVLRETAVSAGSRGIARAVGQPELEAAIRPIADLASKAALKGAKALAARWANWRKGAGEYLPVSPQDVEFSGSVHANGLAPDSKMPDVPYFSSGNGPDVVAHVGYKITELTMPSSAGGANVSYVTHTLTGGLPTSIGVDALNIARCSRYAVKAGGYMVVSKLQAGTKNLLGRYRMTYTTDATASPDTPSEMTMLMSNSTSSAMALPTQSRGLYIECDPSLIPGMKGLEGLMVRTSATFAGDQNDYDHGKLVIELEAGTDTTSNDFGELWFFGTIVAQNPVRLPTGLGFSRSILAGVAAATPLGTSIPSSYVSGLGNGITVTPSTRVVSFDSCCRDAVIRVSWIVYGTGAVAITYPTLTLSSGIVALNSMRGSDGTSTSTSERTTPSNSTSSTTMCMIGIYRVIDETATITYGTGGTFPTSISTTLSPELAIDVIALGAKAADV